MQNISFLVIVGVLLSCAYFFSEQTRVVEEPEDGTATAIPTVESRESLPECSELTDDKTLSDCYQEAGAISQRLVDNLKDQILSYQDDSADRMAFLEMQQAWGKSRDADCGFVHDQAGSDTQGEIERERCLVDRNLARLDQLEAYLCDYYESPTCKASVQSNP